MTSITFPTGAERFPDADYSISHRAPPVPPSSAPAPIVPYSSNHSPAHSSSARPASRARSSSQRANHSSHPRAVADGTHPPLSLHNTDAAAGSRKRSGSLTRFLRRNSSHDIPVPDIPQAHQQAYSHQDPRRPSASHHRRTPSDRSSKELPLPPPPVADLPVQVTTTGPPPRKDSLGPKMLRKISRSKQEREQERLRAEAARQQRPAPRLPSPNMTGFDSNSSSIFESDAYTTSAPPVQPLPNAANFSRPAYSAMPSSQPSSSPAYAVGSAHPPSSSPTTNGAPMYEPPASRAESMTNRGRYSYASSIAGSNINSPRRVRRRKDPTPFNVLVIGGKGSGKTSFISLLRHSLATSSKSGTPTETPTEQERSSPKSSFTSQYLETEIEGERVGVTLWDSAGLERNIVDLQLREMATFVESKFEETFIEEQKVMRSPGVQDTHIHCVFLVLDPVRLDSTIDASRLKEGVVEGGLDRDLDLQVMRALWGKTTVIPVISKADTLTIGHMGFLKRAVSNALKAAKLDPLEALGAEDDDDDDEDDTIAEESSDADDADDGPLEVSRSRKANPHKRQSSISQVLAASSINEDETPYLPMSILSPDPYDLPPFGKSQPDKLGRRFAWGFADPYDPKHCDFTRLRDSIFTEWRGDLRDLARTKWYENWRTSRLKNAPASQRVRGGVTPVNAVPREGRIASPPAVLREYSSQSALGVTVPRSVSGHTSKTAPSAVSAHAPATNGQAVV